jgi:hypothetical protein
LINVQRHILGLAIVVGLASCDNIPGASIGELMAVDPGIYEPYTCNNLHDTYLGLTKRERELKNLMDKASHDPGGEVVNLIAYRDEYTQNQGNQKLVLKVQREKNCQDTAKGNETLGPIH